MKDVIDERAIIAYGDVTGCSIWARRVPRERVKIFLFDTYKIYEEFQSETGMWVKGNGDGFISVCTLSKVNDQKKIIKCLEQIWNLTEKLNNYIRIMTFPRPIGFRTRIVLGEAWKLTMKDDTVDYMGEQMDFGRRLCDVAKEETLIVSEAVFDALHRRSTTHLQFKRINVGPLALPGVHIDDQQNFWTFRIKRGIHVSR